MATKVKNEMQKSVGVYSEDPVALLVARLVLHLSASRKSEGWNHLLARHAAAAYLPVLHALLKLHVGDPCAKMR